MWERTFCGQGAAASDVNRGDIPKFLPSIDTEEIFRRLIADELRNGRLTPARRRRIVRYAAQLKLSAVEAARLVEASRKEALQSNDAAERYHALRLVEPGPTKVPIPVKTALAVTVAIFLGVLAVLWLW